MEITYEQMVANLVDLCRSEDYDNWILAASLLKSIQRHDGDNPLKTIITALNVVPEEHKLDRGWEIYKVHMPMAGQFELAPIEYVLDIFVSGWWAFEESYGFGIGMQLNGEKLEIDTPSGFTERALTLREITKMLQEPYAFISVLQPHFEELSEGEYQFPMFREED